MNRFTSGRSTPSIARLSVAAALASLLIPGTCARGADITWTGALNNQWGFTSGFPLNLTNWSPFTSTPGSGSDVLFDDTGMNNIIQLGGNRSIRSIEFAGTNGYTLSGSGNTLTLGSGDLTASGALGVILTTSVDVQASAEWDIGDGATVIVNGGLDESGTTPFVLTKSGAGTLQLSNNRLAGTIVTGGTLRFVSDFALGETGADITMSDGTTLATTFNAGSITTDAGRRLILESGEIVFGSTGSNTTVAWDGTLQGAGALTKQGMGALRLRGTAANTNPGLTTVAGGTLQLEKTPGVNAVGADILVDGGTLVFAADDQLNESAVVTLESGEIDFGATSQSFHTLAVGSSESLGLSAGSQLNLDVVDASSGGTFTIGGGSTLSVDLVLGTLRNSPNGTLAPGDSAGTTHITGKYQNNGTLAIELGGLSPGTEHDQVIVDGTVVLSAASALDVTLIDGFVPSPGDEFNLLDFASRLGVFGTVNLPSLDGGMTWDQSRLNSEGELLVLSSLPGDYNNDGLVDAADYTVWRDNLGAPAGALRNDFAGGAIGAPQYDAWAANFGATLPLPSLAVPEPSVVAALTAFVVSMAAGVRQRRANAD